MCLILKKYYPLRRSFLNYMLLRLNFRCVSFFSTFLQIIICFIQYVIEDMVFILV